MLFPRNIQKNANVLGLGKRKSKNGGKVKLSREVIHDMREI